MTTYDADHDLPNSETDQLVADWLDDASIDSWPEHALVDALRAADLAFLDALLEQVHHSEQSKNAARLTRVVAALHAEHDLTRSVPPAATRNMPTRRRRILTAVTVVAALLLGIGTIYWFSVPSRVAVAAVQDAFRTAADNKDRQYAVHTRVRTLHGELTEFDAMLYVRGPSKFALHHPGFIGDIWIGGNGSQYWIKPAIGPAQTVDRLQQPLRWAETDAFGLPNLQMTELLSYLVDDYELTFVGDEPAGDGTPNVWRHVRGLHRLGTNERPDLVDLWADPQSGLAHRLELSWQREPVAAGLEHVSLLLVGEEPQETAWYDPTSHGTKAPTLPRSPLLVPSGK